MYRVKVVNHFSKLENSAAEGCTLNNNQVRKQLPAHRRKSSITCGEINCTFINAQQGTTV